MFTKRLVRLLAVFTLCLVMGGGFYAQKNYCAFNLYGVLAEEAGGFVSTDHTYVTVAGDKGRLAGATYMALQKEGVYDVAAYNAWKARHGGQSAILYYNGAAAVVAATNQEMSNLQAGGYDENSRGMQFLQNGMAYQQALAAQQAVPSVPAPAPAVPAVPASPQAFTSNPEANAQILALQQQYMLAAATGDVALQAQCLQLIQVIMAQNAQ